MSRRKDPICKCCDRSESESIAHAMFVCPAHNGIREVFIAKCSRVYPEFAGMNTDQRLCLLMADDPPIALENILYHYLIKVTASRESRLGILAAQEKGS